MKRRNKIKNLILFTAGVIILNSCGTEGYKITGNIENGSGKVMHLDELTIRSMQPLDSVVLDENGTFEFSGEVLENPKFLILYTKKNDFITLLLSPNDKDVVISADANSLGRSYKVEGSPESILVKQLNDRLNNTLNKIDSLGNIYRKKMNDKNFAALKASLDSSYFTYVTEQKEFLQNFIETNVNSMVCIPALFQQISAQSYILDISKDFKYFEMVDSALMSKYSDVEQITALDAYIKDVKRKIKEQAVGDKLTGIGAVAPDIALPTPDGDTLALSSFRGKYVLLDFWASWCKPCRMENPNIVATYNKYKDKGFDVFQVSLDKTKDAWIEAIEKDNLQWHNVSDLQYWNSGPARLYSVRSIPANFLLDKDGKIIAKNLRGPALAAKLAEIFANK